MRTQGPDQNAFANLGRVVRASHVVGTGYGKRRAHSIILLLALSVALMMTGYGIIMPVFARRLAELDAGVEALGLMTTGFALGQLLGAPPLGGLADRIGRRPLVLLALAALTVTNVAYLVATSATAFVVIRAFGGALTAGLFPSAMGVVSDLIPERERGRWIGIGIGGYGAGYVLGPVIGGILYDGWGLPPPSSPRPSWPARPVWRQPSSSRRRERRRHGGGRSYCNAGRPPFWPCAHPVRTGRGWRLSRGRCISLRRCSLSISCCPLPSPFLSC